jgi:hypothetical protein
MLILATTAAFVLSAASSTGDFAPRTVEAEGKGSATASLTGLTKPALTGFRLRYMNGDHEVKEIAMKADAGNARGVLEDQNGDDDMSMVASYAGWDYYRPSRSSKACRGTCTVPIDAPPSNLAGQKRLVLVNFDILVKDDDHRVRVLSIRPSADERSYRVEFRDNGTFDYWVTLDYAWIAGTHSGKLTGTASRSAAARTARLKIGQQHTALTFISGFSVEFNNGEHNFGDLAFERDATGQYYTRFNDANYDDPMTATLDLVWIRG